MTDTDDDVKPSLSEGQDHIRYYSEEALSEKLLNLPKSTCGQILETVLQLWETLLDGATPWPIKLSIISCLGYFVCPVDAVPDLIPGVGYADDFAAMTLLLSALSAYLTPEIRRRALRRMPASLRKESEEED
jgi:uncharacterized membrane protein YkvA (DUF1232 family)